MTASEVLSVALSALAGGVMSAAERLEVVLVETPDVPRYQGPAQRDGEQWPRHRWRRRTRSQKRRQERKTRR